MREQAQLIRISHPQLGSYEVDLIRCYPLPDELDPIDYIVYLLINDESTPPTVGERLVIKWVDSTQNGRGVISHIEEESIESGDVSGWKTFKLSIVLNDQSLDLRHYPRLLGGVSLFYTPLDALDDSERWLNETTNNESFKDDPRFLTPLDSLMNFSVSGLSFESSNPLKTSHLLLCALGLGTDEELIRCLGKVVRCQKSGEHFNIAINFVSPPPVLTRKLSEFTLKLQRIETEGEHNEI